MLKTTGPTTHNPPLPRRQDKKKKKKKKNTKITQKNPHKPQQKKKPTHPHTKHKPKKRTPPHNNKKKKKKKKKKNPPKPHTRTRDKKTNNTKELERVFPEYLIYEGPRGKEASRRKKSVYVRPCRSQKGFFPNIGVIISWGRGPTVPFFKPRKF